jgi:DNA-directed RNA polymerase specialized sigma24 family protein
MKNIIIQDGNEKYSAQLSVNDIFNKFEDMITGIARKASRKVNKRHHEDVLQDARLKVYQIYDSYKPDIPQAIPFNIYLSISLSKIMKRIVNKYNNIDFN